jgi:hypothetical protein
MAIKTIRMGGKSRRNERGYDLVRIGSNEGKDIRTIQYPVKLNFTVRKRAR